MLIAQRELPAGRPPFLQLVPLHRRNGKVLFYRRFLSSSELLASIALGMLSNGQNLIVPLELFDIVEHRPRCI